MSAPDIKRRSAATLIAELLAIVLLVLATGCNTGDQQAGSEGKAIPIGELDGEGEPLDGGQLIVGVPADTNGWNPFINQWNDSGTLIGSSFIEPLVIQDNSGQAQPWLIESWKPSANFTQWDLNLRPGVLFHDMTPFDAAAAKKSLDASFQSGLYQVALGPLYDHVEVTGPLSVRVYLKVRWAQYPTSLANQWALAPAMIDRPDGGVLNPVGTGPFRFESWSQFHSLASKRFEKYWRRDAKNRTLPYIDALRFEIIHDDAAREQALKTGTIDVALSTSTNIATNLASDFDIIQDYTGQRSYLALNTMTSAANKGNPFNNIHARKAVAYATDRRKLTDRLGPEVQSTTYGFRPDSPWAPEGPDGYVGYDPAAARRELDAYRKDTGRNRLQFTVNGSVSTETDVLLLDLKKQLAEVGIEMTIDSVENAKVVVLTALGQYHAAWLQLFNWPDPDQMNFYWSSTNTHPPGELALNFTRYSSPRLDANLKVVRESLDQKARKQANDAIIRETNEQVTSLWLYDTPESLVSKRHVKGLGGFHDHAFANALPKPWLGDAWLTR